VAERALNPLIGKSLVLYARKPVPPDGTGRGDADRGAGRLEGAHAGA
jgi:hypothetical protein